jgi:hypothetical protein
MRVHQRGRHDAGRRRGHELLGESAAGVLPEARDLVTDRRHVGVFHRGDRLRRVGDPGAVHEAPGEGRHQVGVLDEILADAPLRLAAIAAHARRHVGLERDALLLAVIADVDAGVLLPPHHFADRTVELVGHPLHIDRLAGLALDQQFGDGVVARQAADMGSQNAVAAGQHRRAPGFFFARALDPDAIRFNRIRVWILSLSQSFGEPVSTSPDCALTHRSATRQRGASHRAHAQVGLKKCARSFSRAARPCVRSKQFTIARRKPPGGMAC